MKQSKEKSKVVWAVIIALIMITSVLGFVTLRSNSEERYKYGKYSFSKVNERWVVYVGNGQISLAYGPRELDNISLPMVSLSDLNDADKIYVTSNPSENILDLQREFLLNVGQFLRPTVVFACTKEAENITGCENRPLKDCEDASSKVKVMIFKENNISNINYYDNCLTIQGSGEEILKKIDKLILKLVGVV